MWLYILVSGIGNGTLVLLRGDCRMHWAEEFFVLRNANSLADNFGIFFSIGNGRGLFN